MKFRAPTARDGAAVFELVKRVGTLEPNTCYAYVLLCSDFGATCMLAEDNGALAGVVIAYRPPSRPDEVFVWQVGVAPEARGTGLGGRLLDALLAAPACASVRYLTATVSPSNEASRKLFSGVARRRSVPFEIGPGFSADLFVGSHEPEELVRIGPFTLQPKDTP